MTDNLEWHNTLINHQTKYFEDIEENPVTQNGERHKSVIQEYLISKFAETEMEPQKHPPSQHGAAAHVAGDTLTMNRAILQNLLIINLGFLVLQYICCLLHLRIHVEGKEFYLTIILYSCYFCEFDSQFRNGIQDTSYSTPKCLVSNKLTWNHSLEYFMFNYSSKWRRELWPAMCMDTWYKG